MKPSARLIKMLKPPTQLANCLDWGKKSKTIVTLHVGRDRIGMAICSHPDLNRSIQPIMPPIKIQLVTDKQENTRGLAKSCVRQLEHICDKHNVGSFVVCWPLQPEGRPGASCGKVLHTLESLLAESDSVLTNHRPVCLFPNDMVAADSHLEYAEDEWGRCAVYARTTTKTYYCASKEQYHIPEGCSFAAADAWETFCRHYWPELYDNLQEDDSDDDECYAAAAAANGKVSKRLATNVFTAGKGGFSMTYSNKRVLSMQLG